MAIQTVLGEIKKEKLGITLPHEHIFWDLRPVVDEPKTGLDVFYDKIRMDNRYLCYGDPYTILDNAFLDNEDIAIRELELFKKAGGSTIVEVTLDDIKRDPLALKRVSEKTGVNIVMGCGHYIDASHSSDVEEKSERELADEIVRDITVGACGTDVKAGIIGEIGTSAEITKNEWKCLRAAGIASLETGKKIQVHTALYQENGIPVLDELKSLGVSEDKVVIDHIDVVLREDYLLKLLDRGAYVEFDNFGKEYYISSRGEGLLTGRFAYDLERAKVVAKLIRMGYTKQILITNDVCLKTMFTSYGGNGYAHILNTVKTMLLDEGVTEEEFNTLMVSNCIDLLD